MTVPKEAPLVDEDGSDDEAEEAVQYNLGFVDEPESHLDLLRCAMSATWCWALPLE